MYSSIFACVFFNCITSFLGVWYVRESTAYHIDAEGNSHFICREVANVPSTVFFLSNGKGIIEYCNGQTFSFDWEKQSDNIMRIVLYKDSLENRIFNIINSNGELVLRENKKDYAVSYLLNSQNYTIEIQNEGAEIDITESEYESLIKKNPFQGLSCFITKGYIDKDRIILILNQESLEIQLGGRPNTQCVFFVKSSNNQHKIPCFLITYDEKGNVLKVNFVSYF